MSGKTTTQIREKVTGITVTRKRKKIRGKMTGLQETGKGLATEATIKVHQNMSKVKHNIQVMAWYHGSASSSVNQWCVRWYGETEGCKSLVLLDLVIVFARLINSNHYNCLLIKTDFLWPLILVSWPEPLLMINKSDSNAAKPLSRQIRERAHRFRPWSREYIHRV